MAERFPTDAELDALIESALQEDVLLPAPRDLHARIYERVQLAALQQQEQARFRNTLITGFAASVSVVAALSLLVVMTNFNVLFKHGVSGGYGLIDYYTTTFQIPWPGRNSGLLVALFLGLGAAAVWAILVPLRGRLAIPLADTGHASEQASGRPLPTP